MATAALACKPICLAGSFPKRICLSCAYSFHLDRAMCVCRIDAVSLPLFPSSSRLMQRLRQSVCGSSI